MPYDPRPVSEGGNSSIDEGFSRRAPKGMFRIIGVDTFDGCDWHEGDFDSIAAALEHATEKTVDEEMLVMHVYDDRGRNVGSAGSF